MKATHEVEKLLAKLAHDLRGALGPLRNGLHMLQATNADAESCERARRLMEKQVDKLARLADDLLDVARRARGEVERPSAVSQVELLPLEPSAKVASVPSGKSTKPSLRVLVVEDESAVAEMLVMLLKIWGHTVQAAPDGPATLALAPTFLPEVILCDIGLPGMSGYELAQALGQQDIPTKPVLVALTGYGEDEDRRMAQDAGFGHHLTKPVDAAALERLLTSLAPA